MEDRQTEWLKVRTAAERAAVSPWTIYTAIERGELRHVRLGGRRSLRMKPEWVDQWLERFAVVQLAQGGAR